MEGPRLILQYRRAFVGIGRDCIRTMVPIHYELHGATISRMSLPAAIAIAGATLGLGLGIGIAAMFYFLYRIFCVLAAAMTGDPSALRRAIQKAPKAQKPEDQKVVAEIPELGIHALSEDPDVLSKLRDKQDSSDTSHNY